MSTIVDEQISIHTVRDAAQPQLARPPVFSSIGEERLDRKRRLAAAFRLFARCGYADGINGHITARDPEREDCFWVNPFMQHFSTIRVSDLVLVDGHGRVVEGSQPINAAAFAIHAQLHQARPDVVAAAHAHSVAGKAFASLGKLLDPITQDACIFYHDHALHESFDGVVLDASEGAAIAATLGPRKAAILKNHGLLTVGGSVDEAAYWFVAMDRCAQAQLLADAAGTPARISEDVASHTLAQIGTPYSGWMSFQPYYEMLLRAEPDLLD